MCDDTTLDLYADTTTTVEVPTSGPHNLVVTITQVDNPTKQVQYGLSWAERDHILNTSLQCSPKPSWADVWDEGGNQLTRPLTRAVVLAEPDKFILTVLGVPEAMHEDVLAEANLGRTIVVWLDFYNSHQFVAWDWFHGTTTSPHQDGV